MLYPFQLGTQGTMSPIMEELMNFHNHTLMIVFLISSLVLYIISLLLTTKSTHTNTMETQEVEKNWTILLAVILILIILPFLWILYMMDEINNPVSTWVINDIEAMSMLTMKTYALILMRFKQMI